MGSRTMLSLPIFARDIDDVMDWSERHFGVVAANRYAVLIEHALSDLRENPVRPGFKTLVEAGQNICTYHLKFSRDSVSGERVGKPRHFILYRYGEEIVEFARLLHDSRDLERHLPGDYRTA